MVEVGQIFGNLTIIRIAGRGPRGISWICLCTCGKEIRRSTSNLISGGAKSCGCLIFHHAKVIHPTKELRKANLLTYVSWKAMMARCHYAKSKQQCYTNIRVCDFWYSFENFLADMGPRPSIHHSIDREDSDGDYCKENCSWQLKVYNSQKIRINNTSDRNRKVGEGISRAWAEGRVNLTEEARQNIGRGGQVRRGRKFQKCTRCGSDSYRTICQKCVTKQKQEQNRKRRKQLGLPDART